jgi:hypothetical protein
VGGRAVMWQSCYGVGCVAGSVMCDNPEVLVGWLLS